MFSLIRKSIRIQAERLEQSIHTLAQFGRNDRGGIDRTTFTPAELAARDWLKGELLQAGLSVRVDAAANLWARRAGVGADDSLPSIAFGSHIDTVPNGGKYDGALGVLMALEVMRTLNDHKLTTRHPLELVSFSAEEPNPFGLSTFGSRSITGKLTPKDIADVKNPEGLLLTEALERAGGSADRFESAVRSRDELCAFLEVHIEQGKRLLASAIPVGVVTAITGIYREEVVVQGEANHAGTTLMEDRNDALTASSELILALEHICANHPSQEVVGTVGSMQVKPNAPNIIPEEVTFLVEIRGKTRLEIGEVLDAWESRIQAVTRKRAAARIRRKLILDQHPSPMDEVVIQVCEEQAAQLGYSACRLGSMAGHDATHMASITRSGMLFVPSLGGKSHCPEEESRIEDIEKVANVLLHAMLELDDTLER